MKELNICQIYENKQCIGYGGNQEWFTKKWAKQAGCASVLASNLFAFYNQQVQYDKNTFLIIMEEMFEIMKPGRMGYPYLYKFGRTFQQHMQEKGVALVPIYQKKSLSYKHALTFVLDCIDNNQLVGMLILYHHAKELEEDNWHWICITGYQKQDQEYDIIFSDCGERRIIKASILFDTRSQNIFKMVTFKRNPQ